ncbi:MAG TPA: HEAT repeat domain-containing protein, partial [Flavobacteriales bacterium]|nr:HEAT repeat domain-containing protein [Flavobacteriales bacterium]
MRIPLLLFSATAILIGCSGATPKEPFPNRWSDVRLSPVLEAQEHRDTKALCSLLEDPEVVVREAAALAFASVQDSVSIPCLLKALGDDVAVVRATAAFSLGFIANGSALEEMAKSALQEKDSTVQRALFTASFLATQRSGQLKDPKEIINYLVHSSGHERIRAADALRRLPD